MEQDKISQQIDNVIKIIETKEQTKAELIALFNNANNHKDISDEQKELLIETVEKKLRKYFPSDAKKILGSKGKKAQDLLEEILSTLKKEFDWSNNKVGSKVKAGGSMISGKQYVCYYISYKNEDNFSTGFHYTQNTPEDNPQLEIDFRKVDRKFENTKENKFFEVELKEEALNLYKEYLKKTIK
jgi:hypothetical protein